MLRHNLPRSRMAEPTFSNRASSLLCALTAMMLRRYVDRGQMLKGELHRAQAGG